MFEFAIRHSSFAVALLSAAVAFAGYMSLINGGLLYNAYMSGAISIGYIVCMIAQFGVCIFPSMRISVTRSSPSAAVSAFALPPS